MGLTFTKEARTNLWGAVAGAGGTNLTVRLYKNSPIVNDDLLASAVNECDFNGYTAQNSSAWSAPFPQTNGDEAIQSPIFIFTHGSSADSQSATGYFVTFNTGSGDKILGVEAFAAPIRMSLPSDTVPVQIVLNLRDLTS